MQSFDFKKNLLPHILIVAGLAIFAILYSLPALQGKMLYQHDTISWEAMSQEARTYHEKTGEPVYWTNSMFGGMPTYTFYVSETSNYVGKVQEAINSMLPKPANFFFIAMLGFYILMHVLRVNRWLAVVGAIAYAFASYNPQIISAGHETKMLSVGYMPAVLAGLFLLYRGKYLSGAALTGIPLGLFVTNAHWQMAYYLMIIILFMVVGFFIMAIKEGTLKQFFIASGVALLVAAIGVSVNMQTLLSTAAYAKNTMRGGESELTKGHDKKKNGGLDKDYAFEWSQGPMETFCLMIPGLYGGASGGLDEESKTYEVTASIVGDQGAQQVSQSVSSYWGPQRFLSGPVYFGAIICFLFVLSLFVVQSKHKWWMAAVCGLAILMSWGKFLPGLNYFLFDTLPMLNKFRTPSIILTIPQLLFPVLGIWALNDIITEKVDKDKLWKSVRTSVIITAGLCIVLGLAGGMFFEYKTQYVANPAANETADDMLKGKMQEAFKDPSAVSKIMGAIKEDRQNKARNSALMSAFFIVLAGGVLWAYSKKKIKGQHVIIALGILVTVDLVPQAREYLGENNFIDEADYEAQLAPRPADQQIMQDPDPYYRVLDLTRDTYNDAIQANFHKCIGGYSPAKLEIYQDLIENQLNKASKLNGQVLNMLNTKYIIVPGQNNQPMPQQNPGAMGNAWFVNEIKWVNTADDEMSSLDAPNIGDTAGGGTFNAAATAIVRNTFKNDVGNFTPAKDSSATVQLAKYGLNNISYRSKNSQAGFAVFSDIYYPKEWTAYIDGKEVPIIRTNYVLRGLKIPAGEHSIDFKFESESIKKGGIVAMLSSFILFGLAIAAIVAVFRKKDDTVLKS